MIYPLQKQEAGVVDFIILCLIYWLIFFDLFISVVGGGASVLLGLFLIALCYPSSLISFSFSDFKSELFFLYSISIYVLLRSIFSEEMDFFISFSKIVIVMASSYVLTSYVIKRFGSYFYIKILIFIFILQSFSPVLYLLIDSYKDFLTHIQAPDISGRDIHGRGVLSLRKSFVSGAGGFFGMSVLLGFFIYILTYFYVTKRIGFLLFFLTSLIVSLAAVIAGRTAVIFIFFSVLTVLWYATLVTRFVIFCALSVFVLILFFLLYYTQTLEWIAAQSILFQWMLEPLVNMMRSGAFSSTSTDVLHTMWFIPDNVDTVFIGDGRYISDDGLYYGGTDVGFLRQMLFGGLPLVAMVIAFSFIITKCMPLFYRVGLLILLFIVHAKGNVILGAPMTMALLASFSVFLLHDKKYGVHV